MFVIMLFMLPHHNSPIFVSLSILCAPRLVNLSPCECKIGSVAKIVGQQSK